MRRTGRVGLAWLLTSGIVGAWGCSSADEGASKAASFGDEVQTELALLDQQVSELFTCAEAGGTFSSCKGWDGVADRALRLGQRMKLAVTDGEVDDRCATAATAASTTVLGWHDAVISWRNSTDAGDTAAKPPPRTSISDLQRAGDTVAAACTSR